MPSVQKNNSINNNLFRKEIYPVIEKFRNVLPPLPAHNPLNKINIYRGK